MTHAKKTKKQKKKKAHVKHLLHFKVGSIPKYHTVHLVPTFSRYRFPLFQVGIVKNTAAKNTQS